jgi:hypothetical protein
MEESGQDGAASLSILLTNVSKLRISHTSLSVLRGQWQDG